MFEDLYENSTMLSDEFLAEEFGYTLPTENPQIIYKNYYFNICAAIFELNAFRPIPSEIEEILVNGYSERFPQAKGLLDTEDERKYIFLLAQAKQLKYDRDNGRTGMIRGEDKKYKVCEDTKEALSALGLIQPVRF